MQNRPPAARCRLTDRRRPFCILHSAFCIRRRRRPRARTFTLVEMLVALAVMTVALAIVAQVFGITTRTASTSAAISEVEAALRSFTMQLEADLAGIDRTRSVLVMIGRTQAAARTEDERIAGQYYRVLTGDPEAPVPGGFDPRYWPSTSPLPAQYSDPRADLLMFFSQTPLPSRAPATAALTNASDQRQMLQRAMQRGAKFGPVQHVYGHAAIGEVAPRSGGGFDWLTPTHISDTFAPPSGGQMSRLPLSRWTLARRATLLIKDLNAPFDNTPVWFDGNGQGNGAADDFARILRGYSGDSLQERQRAADAVDFDYEAFLALFNVPSGPVVAGNLPAARRPYLVTASGQLSWQTSQLAQAARQAVWGTLFPYGGQPADDTALRHVATVVENPPAELQSNLTLQALPGCMWFQVEFLLPEDPRNSRDHPFASARTDMARWCQVEPGRTYVFVPDNEQNRALVASQVQANGAPIVGSRAADFAPTYMGMNHPPGGLMSNRIIRMWPYAIRITVRAMDRDGRLEEPIVRRIVHRFD